MEERRHLRRIALIWLAVAVVATPIVALVGAPGLPPGDETSDASAQVTDNQVLLAVVTPIAAFLVVYFVYALIVFRHRGPEGEEGVAVRGHRRVGVAWLAVTTTVVLGLASFGTVRLFETGAGGGQGADPIFNKDVPEGPRPLQIQVIGQQWAFTYRFPTFGGVETPHLELPIDREVEFHVTSLDVIHSFWSHQLGVKADANPGVDNIAYAHPSHLGSFEVRCAELCGLWHGHMFDTGAVVSKPAFSAWIRQQQRKLGPATRNLNPYRHTYLPVPERRAG